MLFTYNSIIILIIINILNNLIMSYLDSLKSYGPGGWKVKSQNPFNAKDVASIDTATVIEDGYGRLQICMLLKSGLRKFAPLSTHSSLTEGEVVDPNSLTLIELKRDDEIIYKVDGTSMK